MSCIASIISGVFAQHCRKSDGIDLDFLGVGTARKNDRCEGSCQDVAVAYVRNHVHDGLINEVAGMNIGEDQDIRLRRARTVFRAFFLCGFGIQSDIEGQRSVDDDVAELSFF